MVSGNERPCEGNRCYFPTQTPRSPTSRSKIDHPQHHQVSLSFQPVFIAHVLCAYWSHRHTVNKINQ